MPEPMEERLTPLSGLDAIFLYLESAGTPMHVGSVMLIELPDREARRRHNYDFHQALAAHIQARLPHAPALRRVLREAPLDLGHPMWSEAESVDLKKHIRKRKLPGTGGRAKLMALVGKLHSQMLSRELPMWQFVVIENVEPGIVALYCKIHHALLDGQGGVALARALLDTEAKPRRPGKAPSTARNTGVRLRKRDLARSATRSSIQQLGKFLRTLPAALKLAGNTIETLGLLRENLSLAPRTIFNRQIGAERSFAAVSLPIEQIKQVAQGFKVSVNDVVMAICSGALRALLEKVHELPDQPLIAAMPVSLREAGDQAANNQVSMVQCSLATDIADPVRRLRAIHAATGRIKRRLAMHKNLIPTDFPGFAAPLWASGLVRLWSSGRIAERLPPLANVAISNVPGPPVALYMAGARVRHYYPVSIVTHGLAFNITVQSYAGHLEFGLTACKDVVARPDIVAKAMAAALEELHQQIAHEA